MEVPRRLQRPFDLVYHSVSADSWPRVISEETLDTVQEHAFVLLQAIYEETQGDVHSIVSLDKIVTRLGMDRKRARAAFGYLDRNYLIKDSREMAELPHVFITASGIDEIEGARQYPSAPTTYFPPVNNII